MALALTMCCGARMPFLLQYLINANIAIFIGEDLLALVRNESRPFRVRNSIYLFRRRSANIRKELALT